MTYIILVLGYHEYGIPLGGSMYRISYLTFKKSIFTIIRSY